MKPPEDDARWDFFVSYVSADVKWAVWIAWQLEAAGSRVLIEAWDFGPGAHWLSLTADGLRGSTRVLAVVSSAYLTSGFAQQVWQAAFRRDPAGLTRGLVLIQIEDVPLPGLLGGITTVDLFGLGEQEAGLVLLAAVQALRTGRAKPDTPPPFPVAAAAENAVEPGAPPHEPASDRTAILSVQAIDLDPHAQEAAAALDWVHLYDGDQPRTRLAPRNPAGWQTMDRELTRATARLEFEGFTTFLLRGAMRQATFFRVGTLLPGVRHHTITYRQGGRTWATNSPKAPVAAPLTRRTSLRQGRDLAVVVGVALDPTDAVVNYLATARVPVDSVLTITPAAGPDDQVIDSPGAAVALAVHIRDQARAAVTVEASVGRVHLFLAGPGGLALLLGHRWSRIRETVVYEHLGAGKGYTPAFTVAG